MKLVEDFHKVHCEKCRMTLTVPNTASEYSVPDGIIEKKKYCPLDKFEIIHYYINKGEYQSKLTCCPSCFHRPPYNTNGRKLPCIECPNDECGFSSVNTSVQKCFRCKFSNNSLSKN